MSGLVSVLRLLQHGDSFFPSGAVSFSWGLEALVLGDAISGPDGVRQFVLGQIGARWAPFERAVVAAAHRASPSLDAVVAIDQHVEVLTPAAELRAGSRRMGQAMLSVFERLETPGAADYRRWVRSDAACGHVSVMQGFLWARSGFREEEALALSAHTLCTGLVGAAVRLGALTHIDAQRILTEARSLADRLGSEPVPDLARASTSTIEAEIAVIQHTHNPTRMFTN